MVNYDAFVIYNPYGADQEFVETMTRVLQAPPYNLRLCVPWTEQNDCDNYLSAEMIEKRWENDIRYSRRVRLVSRRG